MPSRRTILAGSAAAALGSARRSFAQPASPTIRIGVLNDQSSTYRDNGGPGSVALIRQAVAEFAGPAGLNVEVLVADHQNKPDVGANIARQWFDQGVDAIAAFVTRAGGRVLGSVAMPFQSTDFSSALLQAQASRAKVVGLANGGDDLVNSIKQAGEFGLTRLGQKLVALLTFINNVHALGLQAAQGLVLTETFYWDLNDRTRAFTRRALAAGFDRIGRPNMSQAANYAGTLHYLKAVASLGAAEAKRSGAAVVARMKAMPVEDDVYGRASVREDGRVITPAYLFEVKKPEESRGPWDYYRLVATTAAEEAWRPLNEGGCPFVRGT